MQTRRKSNPPEWCPTQTAVVNGSSPHFPSSPSGAASLSRSKPDRSDMEALQLRAASMAANCYNPTTNPLLYTMNS